MNYNEGGFMQKEDTIHSNINLANVIHNSWDVFLLNDSEGNILFISNSIEKVLGYTINEYMDGHRVGDYAHEEDKTKLFNAYKNLLKYPDKPQKLTVRIKNKEGKWVWVESLSTNMLDDPSVQALVTIFRDIHKEKEAELLLENEKEKAVKYLNIAGTMLISLDTKGSITLLNKKGYEILGYPEGELLGKNWFDTCLPKKIIPEIKKVFNKIMNGNIEPVQYYENPIIRKDENLREMLWHNSLLRNNEGDIVGLLSSGEDITERKNAEKKLRENEENFRLIFNTAPNLITSVNKEGIIVDCNQRSMEVLGYSKEEIIGNSMSLIIHPDYMIKAEESLKEILEEGVSYNKEYKMIKKNKDLIDVQINSAGLKNKDGEYFRTICIIEDITEKKKAETAIKNLNKDLEKRVIERTTEVERLLKQKDEFIGQLGHDLKSPLAPFVSLLPVLKKQCKTKNAKDLVDVLIRNTGYMKNLVTKTLQLAYLNSPTTKLTFKELNLYQEIENNSTKNQLKHMENSVQIINQVPSNITIMADKIYIQELFNNLISNAIKYSEKNVQITIEALCNDSDVTILIKDMGIGIKEEEIPLIFNEFHKTDSSRHDFDSSGLGLTICKRIVELHGGHIWVESEGMGRGSTFKLTIPK